MEKKYLTELKEAIRHLKIADRMTFVTYPLVNEKKLLIKIFEEIYISVIKTINAILFYEEYYKKINTPNEPEMQINFFIENFGKTYNLSEEQINRLNSLIKLEKKHKKSAVEFVRKENVVFLSDNLETKILNLNDIKNYLNFAYSPIINLDLSAFLTYMNIKAKSGGIDIEHLVQKPDLLAGLIGSYKFGFGLKPQIEIEYTGKQFDSDPIDGSKFVEIDPSLIFNLRLAYSLTVNDLMVAEVFARLNNMTDEFKLSQWGLPAEGRTAYIGLNLKI